MSYCEHCEKEYPGLTCPVCGSTMLQEVDPESMPPDPGGWSFGVHSADEIPWPLDAGGEPEEPVRLAVCPDYLAYGALTVTRLEAAGIPVLTHYPKSGGASRLYTGVSETGVELLVPQSRLEEAKRLLPPEGDPKLEGE